MYVCIYVYNEDEEAGLYTICGKLQASDVGETSIHAMDSHATVTMLLIEGHMQCDARCRTCWVAGCMCCTTFACEVQRVPCRHNKEKLEIIGLSRLPLDTLQDRSSMLLRSSRTLAKSWRIEYLRR